MGKRCNVTQQDLQWLGLILTRFLSEGSYLLFVLLSGAESHPIPNEKYLCII